MKKNSLVAGALIFLSSFTYLPDNKKIFRKLFALEGVWKMNTKRGTICEEWEKTDKNYLQSRGYMIKAGDTIINERVALRRTKDGIFYTSTVEDPNDKNPVAFKMTSGTDNTFVFENKEHDFPKRIVYQLLSADSLHAFIDDAAEGTKKVQHFYYSRQKK